MAKYNIIDIAGTILNDEPFDSYSEAEDQLSDLIAEDFNEDNNISEEIKVYIDYESVVDDYSQDYEIVEVEEEEE